MQIVGIDVGGSGIKAALVDTKTGALLSERIRYDTPQPSKPKQVAKTIKKVLTHFDYQGPIGCSFPTIVDKGRALSFGNLHPSWKGTQIDKLFEKKSNHRFIVHNDADLAGQAEVKLGVGRGLKGMVVMITIGTGLGSGMFYNGVLIPNLELGRILGKDGRPIEYYAGDKARKDNKLSWKEWGKRFDFYLTHLVRICSPDYIILGGGASKKFDQFKKQLTIDTPILIAHFENNAGIIGAAIAAKNAI